MQISKTITIGKLSFVVSEQIVQVFNGKRKVDSWTLKEADELGKALVIERIFIEPMNPMKETLLQHAEPDPLAERRVPKTANGLKIEDLSSKLGKVETISVSKVSSKDQSV